LKVPAVTSGGPYLFYRGSAFDVGSNRNAIATNKTAELLEKAADFGNNSSYPRGVC
jgi:hypothetical protein